MPQQLGQFDVMEHTCALTACACCTSLMCTEPAAIATVCVGPTDCHYFVLMSLKVATDCLYFMSISLNHSRGRLPLISFVVALALKHPHTTTITTATTTIKYQH